MRSAPPGNQGDKGGREGGEGNERGEEDRGEGEGDDSDLGELVTDDLLQLGAPFRPHLISLCYVYMYMYVCD